MRVRGKAEIPSNELSLSAPLPWERPCTPLIKVSFHYCQAEGRQRSWQDRVRSCKKKAMCFLPKTQTSSLRGIKTFYKLSGWTCLGGEHVDYSHTLAVYQWEKQEPLFAWFYNRFTLVEHIWKSKRPYTPAYYTDLDKPQVRSRRLRHNCYPQARPDIPQLIAYKTDASPVCQHRHYKGVSLILLGGQH